MSLGLAPAAGPCLARLPFRAWQASSAASRKVSVSRICSAHASPFHRAAFRYPVCGCDGLSYDVPSEYTIPEEPLPGTVWFFIVVGVFTSVGLLDGPDSLPVADSAHRPR